MKAIIVAGLAVSTLCGGASVHAGRHGPASADKAVPICPVGKIKAMMYKGAATSRYKGKTYYFCCPECKPAFDKDPEKYLKVIRKKASPAK